MRVGRQALAGRVTDGDVARARAIASAATRRAETVDDAIGNEASPRSARARHGADTYIGDRLL